MKQQVFMNLTENDPNRNIIPFDGTVNYWGKILTDPEINFFYECLLAKCAWKNDEAIIFGKHFITARKVAWYADEEFSYTYSNITKEALVWTDELLAIKQIVEQKCGSVFNSCLLNLYHNGNEGMAWHSDDEKALGKNTTIASLTLGAERKFMFKHKQTKETVSIQLENGSLLIMKDTTQTYWWHRLPPTKKVHEPRINLTFRTMIV